MKPSRISLAVLLALSLSACGGDDDDHTPTDPGTPGTETPGTPGPSPDPSNPGPVDPGTPVEPVPEAKVLLEETFDGLTALPAGWTALAGNRGTAAVRDGSLFIDGRADSTNLTTVSLPASLMEASNYRIDVEFTFLERNNASRWGSVIYRSSDTATRTPYYQFAMRATATAANGTELAQRTTGNAWNVVSTKANSEDIDAAKTYKATVIVHGNRVRQYLNNTLLHDFTIDANMAKGGIGLSTAGLVMRVDSIKVTEQLEALPELSKFVAVQDSGTKAAMAPTVVQTMTAATSLDGSRASQGLYNLDGALKLTTDGGADLGTLQAWLAMPNRSVIPVLRIKDEATVTALTEFAMENDLTDVTLLSDNVALLRKARIAMPSLRTAVDFSKVGILGDTAQDVVQVVSATNRALAKIAVLPAAMSNRQTIEHVQRLLITPWVVSNATTQAEAAAVLTTGANGVIATQAKVYADVLALLPANTLLRKPLVTGHRGMPGRSDENTIEGSRLAVQAGADAVENDIYMTTDNHLVVMHDATVDRTTTSTGNIEAMTLAQVRELRTKPSGYRVPTLDEYFAEFKNNKKVTHFVEIKSSKAGIVKLLKEAIDRHGVSDQVVVISFVGDQLNRMKNELPGVTGGFLTGVSDAGDDLLTARNILGQTQTYSSTFNPSYNALTSSMMETAKHRGVTFWPWTLRDRSEFNRFYSYGTHGITTDDAWWASEFVVGINSATTASAATGQALSLPVQLTTQVGGVRSAVATKSVVLAGAPAHTVNSDGSVTFTAAGTATLLPGHTQQMDAQYSYTIFGGPVTVTVR